MMRGLQISIPQRLAWLRVVLVTSLFICIFTTLRMWYRGHLFPAASLVPFVEAGDGILLALTILACVTLLASLIFRWYRLLLAIGISCILLLVVLDVNRLQQWVFMYCSMLAVIVFYNGRVDDPNNFTSYFILLQIMLCGFYFYTGVHQLQPGFIENELSAAASPLKSVLSARQFELLLKFGHVIPYLLMFTAIALFVAPMRYLGITLAVIMHLALLVLQYPLKRGDLPGYIFNLSLLPVALLLFSGKTKQRYFSPAFVVQRPLFFLVVIVFLIMPAFNNNGRWPDEMSGNIHSGNRQKIRVVFPVATYLRLPLFVKNFCHPENGRIFLDHQAWCRYELSVCCGNSRPVMKALLGQLEFWNKGPVKGLELITTHKRDLLLLP